MAFIQPIRQLAGDLVDTWATGSGNSGSTLQRGLPELGWSERIAGGSTVNTGKYKPAPASFAAGNTQDLSNPAQKNYSSPYDQRPTANPRGGFGSLTNSGSGNPGSGFTPPPNPNDFIQNPDQSGEGDVINSEFENFNRFLDDQEGLANQQFSNTAGAINTEKTNALNTLQGEQGIREKELAANAESGRQTERLNLQKVRQLLQDLQQRDNARIAITGGGSVNEALADRFARRAQADIGGVQAEGQRYQNDVLRESERVSQFYDNKRSEIRANAQARVDEARMRLDSALSNIRAERRSSADAKARASIDAWRDYYNKINTARLEAQNLQAQLDIFRQQKDATLSQAAGFALNDIAGQDVSGVVSNLQNTTSPQIGGDFSASQQLPGTYVNFSGQDDDEENQLVG